MGIKMRITLALLILLGTVAVAVATNPQPTVTSSIVYATSESVMFGYPVFETSVYEEFYPYPPVYKNPMPTADPNMTPAPKIFIPIFTQEVLP